MSQEACPDYVSCEQRTFGFRLAVAGVVIVAGLCVTEQPYPCRPTLARTILAVALLVRFQLRRYTLFLEVS